MLLADRVVTVRLMMCASVSLVCC